MKKILLALTFTISVCHFVIAQTPIQSYTKKTYMIPMRDGVKLHTVVLSPTNVSTPLPILIQRTPYGADLPDTYDILKVPYVATMAKEGYIFVFQDMRGKFKSEGVFEMSKPLYHMTDRTKVDESTDAYDAIDWLVKHVPNNNGKAGIFGISYLGWTALDATTDPHPALKASCPQASPADWFLGDDMHHNGAFRLSYGLEYSYMVENAKEANSSYPFPQYDLFNWYLKLGSLKNVNEKYFKGKVPSWNNFAEHPNYDSFWKRQTRLSKILYPQIPVLHVGGYYDQEDLNGPQVMYSQMEKRDSSNKNFLLLGPWYHGQWAGEKADSLGKINFGSKTAVYFQDMQKRWFDYWLKGIGNEKLPEVTAFQTGSNTWKSYNAWPPKNVEVKRLYTHANGSAAFAKPTEPKAAVSYISDPAHPVPYRTQPIEATYAPGSRWRIWQVEDQRFVSSRPDVVSFTADTLQSDVTVTGNVEAHLYVSTTGTDADFVVKLIDVYPNFDARNIAMSGYEFPVSMEVYRGRFRKSFETPEPFVPGKPEHIVIDLHNINHTFLKGHKMMIQIQSTWFPVIDRNPQKYVPNIFEAKEADFIKATQTIHCNNQLATYIELPVVKD